ncbi:MAG TPA: 2-iminoacetate synthase ThiH [Candidatus Omnitrophota bacterium]|nr:2-iminoacetate synthase ThiH [Candidatus Omnitrophota bacterium]HPT39414.1 2-iminoacetate synthase ThiH [Candidatus Omnitrophota bacterium]
MSFYDICQRYKDFDLERVFNSVSSNSVKAAFERDILDLKRFIFLLSPEAENNLESMAQKAQVITRRNFGKSMQLYTPLYLSNYCENSCSYCGFNLNNKIERKKLSLDEVQKEAQLISASGLKHILILTGESRGKSPVSYIRDCVSILKKRFSSIAIEVYPLTEDEYAVLVLAGADGLTIYQETYDERLYAKLHLCGPKKDYRFRLDAPERGAKAGMRSISIGALLGLGDWRREAFFLGLHAKYLQDNFPDIEIGVSVPRIQPQTGDFKAARQVSDKNITQIILALRIFLPRLSIALSTRESPGFREALIPLGVTKISAGSVTSVGGHAIYAKPRQEALQFQIQDQRSVNEIKIMLEKKGYQPVFKDWLDF